MRIIDQLIISRILNQHKNSVLTEMEIKYILHEIITELKD